MNFKSALKIIPRFISAIFFITVFTFHVSAQFDSPKLQKSVSIEQREDYSSFAQQQKVALTEGVRTNNFGISSAISGTTAVIGSNLDDVSANKDQGAAFVYVRNLGTWTLQAQLNASSAAANDLFGSSVAIDGNTIIVGATKADGANADSGAAYIFTRTGSTWTQQAKLTATDGATNDNFGASVSISGNTVVIGANLDTVGLNQKQGSTYVFVRSGKTWTQQAKLNAGDGAANSNFGASVSISTDSLISGANANAGAAYVFTRTGTVWTQQAKLVAMDAAANDNFGVSVSINGDVAVIGANLDDVNANVDQGSAYVFQRIAGNWLQLSQLVATDAAANDNFGASVNFDGTSIIIGANLDDIGSNVNQGSAYVFVRNMLMMFAQQAKLTDPRGAANDNLGISVGVSANLAIGGANLSDADGRQDQGIADAFFGNGNGTFSQPDYLLVSDAATFDQFGSSAAISGTTAIVGAFNRDINSKTNQGAVYVYTKGNSIWGRQAQLTANDGAATDFFGYRLAIMGDTAVVGAVGADVNGNENQGAVYIYIRNNGIWTQQAKLVASDGAAFDYFGQGVAISGDSIIIGASFGDINSNTDQGAAYIFTRNGATWTQTAKLTVDDGATEDYFGREVAINGNTVIVSANGDDIGENNGQGSAYVFVNNNGTWTQTQKLIANDGQSASGFGSSVAISGNTVAIGAMFDNIGSNRTQGSIYAFTNNAGTWTQQAKLTATDGATGDYLGQKVAIDKNLILGGAPYSDFGASNTRQGAAYVFERTGTAWTQRQKIVATDGAQDDTFGDAVAIEGINIVIGAPFADIVNSNSLTKRNADNVINGGLMAQGATYFLTSPTSTTAAGSTLSGKVVTSNHRPIRNVRVKIESGNVIEPRYATTNAFGRYQFENLPSGATYIVTAFGKRFTFAENSQAVNLNADETNVDFIALQ